MLIEFHSLNDFVLFINASTFSIDAANKSDNNIVLRDQSQ